jgi:hypothetical protein
VVIVSDGDKRFRGLSGISDVLTSRQKRRVNSEIPVIWRKSLSRAARYILGLYQKGEDIDSDLESKLASTSIKEFPDLTFVDRTEGRKKKSKMIFPATAHSKTSLDDLK